MHRTILFIFVGISFLSFKQKENPSEGIEWQAWTSKTIQEAKTSQKLLFINLSPMACEGCQLFEDSMNQESSLANYINQYFVPIKINPVLRPDLSEIYRHAYEITHGKLSLKKPLIIIALPSGSPYHLDNSGDVNMLFEAVSSIQTLYETNETLLQITSKSILREMQEQPVLTTKGLSRSIQKDGIDALANQLIQSFDPLTGRFGTLHLEAKASDYLFLMNYYYSSSDKKVLDLIEKGLTKIGQSPLRDHINGGFFTKLDAKGVPSFEKDLTSNALMIDLYLKGFQLTKNPLYQEIALETLQFIEDNFKYKKGQYRHFLVQPKGQEYYTFTYDEIAKTLQYQNLTEVFCQYFGVKKQGKYLLTPVGNERQLEATYGLTPAELKRIIASGKVSVSQKRFLPKQQDIFIASSSALLLKNFALAYRLFDKPEYLANALAIGDFLEKVLTEKGNQLKHGYYGKALDITGFLDDYAQVSDAYIELYQAGFDENWLYKSKSLTEVAISQFMNFNSDLFSYTSIFDGTSFIRKSVINDKIASTPNALMAKNIHRLGLYFFERDYMTKVDAMLGSVLPALLQTNQPTTFSSWGIAFWELHHEPYEVTVIGENYRSIQRDFDKHFLPNVIFSGGKKEGTLMATQGKLMEGETMIYVCQEGYCKMPTDLVKEALLLIER